MPTSEPPGPFLTIGFKTINKNDFRSQIPRRPPDDTHHRSFRTTTIRQRRGLSPLHPTPDTLSLGRRRRQRPRGIRLSLRRGCGFEEIGFLRRWRSEIVLDHLVFTSQVSFQAGFEHQQRRAVEHELEHFGVCYQAACFALQGPCLIVSAIYFELSVVLLLRHRFTHHASRTALVPATRP